MNECEKDLDKLIQGARAAAELMKVLAHETRLMAVCYIGEGERCVGELEQFLGTSQSNISQHLCKLKDRGVLEYRKEANQVFYRVKDRHVLAILSVLQHHYC